jgi:hypothetical protein
LHEVNAIQNAATESHYDEGCQCPVVQRAACSIANSKDDKADYTSTPMTNREAEEDYSELTGE